MALVTISGYPCSGKTRRAEQIKRALEQRLQSTTYTGPRLKVSILSDDTLNLSRTSYNGQRLSPTPHPALYKLNPPSQRHSIREASSCRPVYGPAETDGSRYNHHHGQSQLHQRVQVPDVLRREGVQAESVHRAKPLISLSPHQEAHVVEVGLCRFQA